MGHGIIAGLVIYGIILFVVGLKVGHEIGRQSILKDIKEAEDIIVRRIINAYELSKSRAAR